MIRRRPSAERGRTRFDWLDSHHTFSFGDYYDPEHMGFRALRVINEDRVKPREGFGTHPHRDMEIITYVLEGVLEHRDSLGSGSVIRPGEVQMMSAGTGVTHSESNPSDTDLVHFLQMWILPERRGLKPAYAQRAFPDEERRGTLRLIAVSGGREGALTLHQDASLYVSLLDPGQQLLHRLAPGRHAWVQVAHGSVMVNGQKLDPGDGAAVSDEPALEIRPAASSEILLFDLA